jgi:peptidoglycan DL-endopeptidase CwlO
VHTPKSVHKVVRQRVAVASAAIIGAGLMFAVAGSAGAAPTPTLSQAEHKVTQVQSKLDRLGQQYDAVKTQLSSTRQRLKLVRKQLAGYNVQFAKMRAEITRIAVTDYEDGDINATVSLLTSGKAQRILNQSSMLDMLSASNNELIKQFLAEARQLENTQRVEQRTEAGIAQLASNLRHRTSAMNKVLAQEQALVQQLTPAQQVATGVGGGSTKPVKYTGPTSTQAEKAVAFAYDQLGCPYVYGGTGPCKDGFDCSGLTMMSWAAAGVSIPRTSYEQWDDLPHVSLSAVQPGDILVFLGAGHVGLYVGHNQYIQAPQPGQDVQLATFSGWNTPGIDGAVRP